MKAEDTIQALYDHYPMILQERFECLDHLLCVIGNGFYWDNGELINDSLNSPINPLIENRACQRKIITDNYRKRIMKIPRSERWYGIHPGYSLITRIPNDIKQDWLDIIIECIEMMTEDNVEMIEEVII